MPSILTILIVLPMAGSLFVLLLPADREKLIKGAGLAVSTLALALSIVLWAQFDNSQAGMQFTQKSSWIPAFDVSFSVGIDGLSLLLVLLTAFLTPIAMLSSWNAIQKRLKEYTIMLLLLETGMLGVFCAIDLFLFYVFWEAMLVPMYFIIGIWGGERRVYAAFKFFLYTMAGSLLMLVA